MSGEHTVNIMSIDVEEWFHILDCPTIPHVTSWEGLETRFEKNLEKLLLLLEETNTQATLFWLGWLAERNKALLKRCRDAGHEIASHGYHHVACARVGPDLFRDDISRARDVLEDILGEAVTSFRAPGFVTDAYHGWCFDVIREAGYTCDSSVPFARMPQVPTRQKGAGCYVLETRSGPLIEVPVSSMMLAPGTLWAFGGGYLRLTPERVLYWTSRRMRRSGQPLVVYLHPRDVDPESPCLHLGLRQHLKFIVNRRTTIDKLHMLLTLYKFGSLRQCVASAGLVPSAKPLDALHGMELPVRSR
jgi:polysaccharide deacetylase family protein (PEP-CTERM system associated)